MNYLTIARWDEWQTYRKDRGTPPWIKVHRNLFSNPEWSALSDSEKGQLISIWILAADKNGSIPTDGSIIQKLCMLDTLPNINKFIELGFIEPSCQPCDYHVATTCQQSDAPETETETDISSSSIEPDVFDFFWKTYPRKQGKKKAQLAFNRLTKKNQSEAIKDCAVRFEGTEPQFIPLPTTYLHGERWNDEPLHTASNVMGYQGNEI